jgi:ABC-type taurine transport system ATPase subunit
MRAVVATERTAAQRTWRHITARMITEVLAPSVLMVILFLAVGLAAAGFPSGLLWELAGAFFASIGPTAIIVIGVQRGRWSDRHLTVREHRRVPLIAAFAFVVLGLVVLAMLHAPREVIATEAAMLAGLVVSTPITRIWKISFHTGVAAAVGLILALALGPILVMTYPLLAAIGWARVQLRDHTVAQVLAAVPIGALSAGLTFVLVR